VATPYHAHMVVAICENSVFLAMVFRSRTIAYTVEPNSALPTRWSSAYAAGASDDRGVGQGRTVHGSGSGADLPDRACHRF